MSARTERTSFDEVIEAYKAGVDRTLLRENLRRTPAERLANLMAMQRFAERHRGAARGPRPAATAPPTVP